VEKENENKRKFLKKGKKEEDQRKWSLKDEM
jgi:hypothetical protein